MPHSGHGHKAGMHYVYLMKSVNHPDTSWVDTTSDVRRRMELHNAGQVAETRKSAPWTLVFYAAFPDRRHAKHFCHYLCSSSGKAFGHKHLWGEVPNEPLV